MLANNLVNELDKLVHQLEKARYNLVINQDKDYSGDILIIDLPFTQISHLSQYF